MIAPDQSIRVLVVEDNPADALLIEHSLAARKREEFTCRTVDLLETALSLLKGEPPDIVLLDLSLPDSTGIAACERIQRACPTVPIVVLTGLDDEVVALEALQRGAQDYLVKGQINSSSLARALRYAVERQRNEVALQQAHDQLEERVAERTEELSLANEELRQAIRDRERAEELARARHEELAHLARLNTLGELASSLAHELNQPLTAIVAYTRSCLRRMSDDQWEDEEVRDELELEMQKAADQAKRGAQIIQRLRRLVSKRDPERVAFSVNESIRDVIELVAAELRASGVELRLELDQSLPTVSADRVQIEQVLVNLIRNAIEAMSNEGGELRVRSASDVQNNIEVKVIDSGTGADAETLGHVFDPFFSTKERGLGLGLSISRSIVESHEGKFSVAPNLDRGLTFRFTLPIQAAPTNAESSLASNSTEEA
jgi:C4-dicarboxylate-specific signal transduction histidine kinase